MTEEQRDDGWVNTLTGLGVAGRDKSVTGRASRAFMLPVEELANLYAGDGFGGRIVDAPVEDALRNGFVLEGDGPDEALTEQLCKTLKFSDALQLAFSYQRAFGGSLIVAMFSNDAEKLDKPVSVSAKVTGFKVYPSTRVDITTSINTDPRSPYFEEVEIFKVNKRFGGTVDFHASRCYAMRGPRVPDVQEVELDINQLYWGMSALQRPYNAMLNFGAFVQGIGHLGQEAVIGKYTLSNLNKLLLQNDVKALKARMDAIEMSKGVIRAVLLGEGESYTRDSLTFAGIPETFDRLAMVLSGVSGIPVTKLLGRSAAGMNATGEGDAKNYYDMVKALQERDLVPAVEWAAAKMLQGKYTMTVKFHPLDTPSMKEEIEMRERQQKIDAGYIADGVLTAEEVRSSRFEGGYSFETSIESPEEGDESVTDA